MTPSRWRQIDSLYRASKDFPPNERPSYLDQACDGDPELRNAVEALLAEDHFQNIEASTTLMAPLSIDRLALTRLRPRSVKAAWVSSTKRSTQS